METIKKEKDITKQIEELVNSLKCPKDFVCYKSGFKKMCRVKDIGIESFLICLDKDSLECRFSVHFGGVYFCQCPLRVLICREYRK